MINDKRPKNIWRFIHRILKPKNQTITVNVDDLNKHFITTANRLLKSERLERQDILKTLKPQKPASIFNASHMSKLKKNSEISV